jgi:hypothetical protein
MTSSSDAEIDPAAIYSSRGSTAPPSIPAAPESLTTSGHSYYPGPDPEYSALAPCLAGDAFSDFDDDIDADPADAFSNSNSSSPRAADAFSDLDSDVGTDANIPAGPLLPGPFTSASFGPIPRDWIDPNHSADRDPSFQE